MIKLSVLIPIYNAAQYIEPLMTQLINQCDDSCEIILLDDGSSDESYQICAAVEKKYPQIVHVYHRENRGTVYTRREMFNYSKGEWIWTIDADDMVPDNAVSAIMSKIADGGFDMILFDYYRMTSTEQVIMHQLPFCDGTVFDEKNKMELYELIVSGSRANQLWNKVFKRELIDFDADYTKYYVKKGTDIVQTLPLITNAKRILYSQAPVYCYNTINQNSLSHAFKDYTFTSLKAVWERKKDFIIKWGAWEDLKEKYYQRGTWTVFFEMLIQFIQHKKGASYKEFNKFFSKVTQDELFHEMIQNCKSLYNNRENTFLFFLKRNNAFMVYYYLKVLYRNY